VNRRRILAGILSVGLLGVCALFLPSLHKTPEPASQSVQTLRSRHQKSVDSHAASEPPIIPTSVVVAKACLSPACAAVSG